MVSEAIVVAEGVDRVGADRVGVERVGVAGGDGSNERVVEIGTLGVIATASRG